MLEVTSIYIHNTNFEVLVTSLINATLQAPLRICCI